MVAVLVDDVVLEDGAWDNEAARELQKMSEVKHRLSSLNLRIESSLIFQFTHSCDNAEEA